MTTHPSCCFAFTPCADKAGCVRMDGAGRLSLPSTLRGAPPQPVVHPDGQSIARHNSSTPQQHRHHHHSSHTRPIHTCCRRDRQTTSTAATNGLAAKMSINALCSPKSSHTSIHPPCTPTAAPVDMHTCYCTSLQQPPPPPRARDTLL
jgi:hypothetical protein